MIIAEADAKLNGSASRQPARTPSEPHGPTFRGVQMSMSRRPAVAVALAAALGLAACGGGGRNADPAASAGALPQGSDRVRLDPADFTAEITHRFWPMKPGDRWVYEETDGDGTVTHDEVTVLDRTERIDGIETRVVHDLATQDGVTVEDTTDWYAQDASGNLWYVGEKTASYENGSVSSTAGSWRAGTAGAQAGIVLPAVPRTGMAYRQEFLAGQAEDRALVLSTAEQVQTPSGTYRGALLTRDTTPLEPDLVELKWYAAGVGPVLTLTPSGEVSREQLVTAPSGP
jgi:hypothetical protein